MRYWSRTPLPLSMQPLLFSPVIPPLTYKRLNLSVVPFFLLISEYTRGKSLILLQWNIYFLCNSKELFYSCSFVFLLFLVINLAFVRITRTMDSALDRLDAARFLQIWQHFDKDDKGYIEGKKMDDFFKHMLHKLGMKMEEITEDKVRRMRERFVSPYDSAPDRNVQIEELAVVMLPVEENFLLLFRRETPLDNSVEFMRIWRNYDTDSSGYISANELKGFLQDLFLQHRKSISPQKLEEYTETMMKMFDKNRDGRLDLNDMARILALNENFLLKFKTDACSLEDRKRDFEKIFAHYDVSKTGALEGPEVDGFVKDMMELVKPSISGMELDKFRKALMGHCDINRDGKIQKNELALCLGLKLS